ncbi:hypothetical protein [Methylophaga sp. OBS4]|uniref:hypothetical protein n=1 Tax=Methylophaga sp. OBS4 TaxID=2991935 RepID=UPI0022512636|nr:hypothetical protein [Methylophaga sp. OBS4]MCX4186480.1 hypothetical protein [Methylophaga sp. OBS4]
MSEPRYYLKKLKELEFTLQLLQAIDGLRYKDFRQVSQHAQTLIWLIEQFLLARFRFKVWQGLYWSGICHD